MSINQTRHWSISDHLRAPAAARVHPDQPEKPSEGAATPDVGESSTTTSAHRRALWWVKLLGHDPEALRERRQSIGEVLALTWGATLFLVAYPIVVFGWGTAWNLWPINWLQLFVSPLARIILNFVVFSRPWPRARAEVPLLMVWLALLQILAALIPTVWALAGSDEEFPLRFLGSRAYFTGSFILGLTGGGFAAHFSNPAMEPFWSVPLPTLAFIVVFHAMRIADPLADMALISIGLRHATDNVCPYRGGQNCEAHLTILSLMSVMLFFDYIAATLVAGVLHWFKLGREAEGRWSTRLECLSIASEAGFTALGIAFVVLGMTSKTGLDMLFVVVCAINTGGLVLWMAMALWSRVRRLQTQAVNVEVETAWALPSYRTRPLCDPGSVTRR